MNEKIVAAIVERDGRYLITQRRQTAIMPLLWEFPGGKVEGDEPDIAALQRELRERLGAEFIIGRLLGEKHHRYDHNDVHIRLFAATLVSGQQITARRINDFRWVLASELGKYEFPSADEELKQYLSPS